MPEVLHVDEAAARQLVLLRAIETIAGNQALLSEAERAAAERELLARRGLAPGQAPDPAWYLPARAAELLRIVVARQLPMQRLAEREVWWPRLNLAVPLLALFAGLLSDRIGNPHQFNLLSLPLLGFVLWNLAVYLLIAVSALLPARVFSQGPLSRWQGELTGWIAGLLGRARSRWMSLVAPEFHLLWWRAAGRLESARLQRVLHFSAAAWAVGVALSLLWAGVATQYRVGWESTWLDAPDVHRVVEVISAPGRAVLRIEPFTLEDVERLHFDTGTKPTAGQARRWALLYVAFLVAVVMLPRLALGLWSGWRAGLLKQRVPLDLTDPYFQQLMDRVSPVRLQVALMGDPASKAVAHCILRQAAAPDLPEAALRTEESDELKLATSAEGDRADLVWLLVASEMDAGALGASVPEGRPLLIICADPLEPQALATRAQALGWQAEALAWRECAACWALEEPLRAAILRLLPPWKQAGLQRLMLEWTRQHDRRWAESRHLMAGLLAAACRDAEKLQGLWPGARKREEAMTALLARLQQRLDAVHSGLLRTNGAGVLLRSGSPRPAGGGLVDQLNQGNAGAAGALAGAAAGALAGAKIDLLTGGLTMGAGAALGALVGGAGAFGAARWWDLGGSVRLSDEQLQSLAESLVTQYLAVIHAGRSLQPLEEAAPANWHSEAVAEVAARADAWRRAWQQARQAEDEAAAAQWVEPLVAQTCESVLRRLYPRRALASLAQAPVGRAAAETG